MKRLLSTLLIIVLFIIAFPINAQAGINKKILILNSSETYTMKIDGVDGKIKWESSDVKVATISNEGIVTPVNQGKTSITGKVGGVTYTCDLRVTTSDKDYVAYEDKLVKAIYKGVSNGCIYFEFINKTDNYYFVETKSFTIDGTVYKNHTGVTFRGKTDNYYIYSVKIKTTDIKNVSGNFNISTPLDQKNVLDFNYSIDIE